jgi:general secretion pathway protein K
MTYRPRTHGFVLVAVLATLVILTTIAGTIALIAQGMVERELASQRMLEGELEEMDTRTSVLYVLLTQRMTFGGLTVDEQVVLSEGEKASAMPGGEPISFMPVGNEIRLDGTVYEGIGGARFALQDDRGRIAVNWMPSAVLAGFLGDASDTDPQTLVHLLADYQDPDDSYRINSAEQAEYLRRGMPPPRNQPLATPLELRRVMGWAEALALRTDEELVGSLGVDRSSMLNVNTAPVAVLASPSGGGESSPAAFHESGIVLPTGGWNSGRRGFPGLVPRLFRYPCDLGGRRGVDSRPALDADAARRWRTSLARGL